MSKDKLEFIREMSTEEAARFLRQLASSLENGRVELDNAVLGWEDIRKLKLKLRNSEGRISLKTELKSRHKKGLKLQRWSTSHMERKGGRQKPFKALKKEMESTFRAIQSSLQQGSLPHAEQARNLHEQALQMLQHADRGQDGYGSFLELTQELEHAVQEENLERCRNLARDLEQSERECHSRLK